MVPRFFTGESRVSFSSNETMPHTTIPFLRLTVETGGLNVSHVPTVKDPMKSTVKRARTRRPDLRTKNGLAVKAAYKRGGVNAAIKKAEQLGYTKLAGFDMCRRWIIYGAD
jgi:hypothetical protein